MIHRGRRAGSWLVSLFCGTAWLALGARITLAQVPAEISGHVIDAQTGRPIPQARIDVVGHSDHADAESDGSYLLRGVDPGIYTICIHAIGYLPYSADAELTNGRTTIVDAALQPNSVHLASIAVHGTKTFDDTNTVPGAVTFDRHAIEGSGHRDLGELLQTAPGVVVTQYGGPGTASAVSIRGSAANEVLVLIDGARLNSPITGEADLSQIPLSNIEQVTVLPGAQSSRYGSQAQAGVVIVQTRRAIRDLSASTRFGSWGERDDQLSVGDSPLWDGRHTNFAVVGDDRTSRGDFPYVIPAVRGGGTTDRINNDNSSRSLSATASVDGDSGALHIRGGWQDMNRGIAGSIVQPSATGREGDSRLSGGADGRLLRGPVTLTAAADVTHEHATFVDTAPPFGGVYNDTVNADAITLSTTGSAQTLFGTATLGAEGRSLRITSDELAPGAPLWQHQFGTWASVRSSHTFTSGLTMASDVSARLDQDSFVHGTTFSPRAEATLSYVHAVLSAAFGQGYTPPSLSDQFFHEGVLVRPNPNLQPERVHGDLTIRAALHDIPAGPVHLGGDIDAYRADVDGMILWFPDYRFVWSPNNYNVHRSGWDISNQIAIPAFGFDVQGTLNQSNVTYAGQTLSGQVAYRPRTTGNVTAGFVHAGARLDLTTRYVGARRTVAGSNLNLLDPYWLTDTHLALPLVRPQRSAPWSLETIVGVENLLNRPAAMLVDYPFPGRLWTVSLRLRHGGTQATAASENDMP